MQLTLFLDKGTSSETRDVQTFKVHWGGRSLKNDATAIQEFGSTTSENRELTKRTISALVFRMAPSDYRGSKETKSTHSEGC